MRGTGPESYGEAFADVYDEWYADVSDVDATVRGLARLAAEGPVLELGIGTGRLALPLAATGLEVHGIDASPAMLERLRAKAGADRLTVSLGNMAGGLPGGPFSLAFCAYNTFFNLTSAEDQQACFHAVAACLRAGARFVIETFVPDDPPRTGSSIDVRDLAVDRVVLSMARYDAPGQRAEGQFVELTEAGGVRLRPWSIRWTTPDELDGMAQSAGFTLEHRWADWDGGAFTAESDHQVSVFLLSAAAGASGVGSPQR